MCNHILENAGRKDIYIDRINGHDDHIHVLMLLKDSNSISKQVQLLKGESSFWANEIKLVNEKFEWADKYFAASVSGRKVPSVRAYIDRQQEHHQQQSFNEEFEHFLNSVGYNPDLPSQG
jgi:REP element-mobilizing transposase RayT